MKRSRLDKLLCGLSVAAIGKYTQPCFYLSKTDKMFKNSQLRPVFTRRVGQSGVFCFAFLLIESDFALFMTCRAMNRNRSIGAFVGRESTVVRDVELRVFF